MKLHIGCGKRNLAGYMHYDIRKIDEHIDFVGQAEDLSQFGDESAEEIYACHLLEHFGRWKSDAVLKEWNRVLKKGGILRIAVPDFEAVVKEYTASHNLKNLMGLLYGGQDYEYNYHFEAFDFDYLKSKLLSNGFDCIKRYDWRQFLPGGYDDCSRAYLPHMDAEHGRLMSLNVMAVKKEHVCSMHADRE